MEAVVEGKEWNLTARTDGSVVRTVDARSLLKDIAEASWQCADPGVQYDTTINQWHTSPNTGRINASNPCSEYMHIDDSACNLSSLNLMKFRKEDGEFDVPMFEHRGRRHVPRAGDHRRLLVVSDARDRPERAQVPASSASATRTSARS
jgi:ribonucleoside-diphosphate reductase alpha chain